MNPQILQHCYCECSPLQTTCWKRSSGKEVEENLSAETIYNGTSTAFAEADVTIIYAEGDKVRECLVCKTAFDAKFRIPPIWWTTLAKRSNGYFGYENVLADDGITRTGTISWVRFIMKRVRKYLNHHNEDDIQYEWVKLNAFTRWYAPSEKYPNGRTEVVLFDHFTFAQKVMDSLISQINPNELGDPFWVYPIMAGEVAIFQDECVWGSRDLIRSYEKQRFLYRDIFVYLHEVSRHSIHINETLYVAESILDSMQKYHSHFTSTGPSDSKMKDDSDPYSQNIQNRLGHLHTTITHLRHRAESNHERVKAEISLCYNKSAQVDSSSTRSISLAGLLFLPAAFVASVFSTSFFNFDAPTGIWGLSDKFWIYWAVTIPVTGITILLWFAGPGTWDLVMYRWNDRQERLTKEKEKRVKEEKEREWKEEKEKEKKKLMEERERRQRRMEETGRMDRIMKEEEKEKNEKGKEEIEKEGTEKEGTEKEDTEKEDKRGEK